MSVLPKGHFIPVSVMDWKDNADDACLDKTVLAEVTNSDEIETHIEIAIYLKGVTRFVTFSKADLLEALK